MTDRAIIFIDGSNWYHSLKNAGITGSGELDYPKICRKLVGPARQWIATRYYVGRVNQEEAPKLYADQRIFFSRLCAADSRITAHFGRLETRLTHNKAAEELKHYLANLSIRIDPTVYHDLVALAGRHRNVRVTGEKAVDVKLAVDMVVMAERGEYDTAYLLTADGDFTPAVEAVRQLGKRVYAASPAKGAQLAQAVNTYIPLNKAWFSDCW